MEDDNSFVWRIQDFSKLEVRNLYSDTFTISGYKWRILCFPKGNTVGKLSLYLDLAESATLPTGWIIDTTFKLLVLDQINRQFSIEKEFKHFFTKEEDDWGSASFMPLSHLRDLSKGYLVNDTLAVKVEIKAKPFGSLTTVSDVVPVLAMKPQEPKADDDPKDVPNIADPKDVPNIADPKDVPNIADPDPTVVQDDGSGGLRRTEVVRLPDLPENEVENSNVKDIKAKPIGSLTTVSNVVYVLAMEPQEPKAAVDDREDIPNIADPDPTPPTEALQDEGSDGLRRTDAVHLPDLPDTKVEKANVNGFQVLASKADAVERIFENHPDFVSNFHFKNKQLRSAFMNAILAVIEKFCKSPVDFSDDDLSYSRDTLTDLENAGFQVDWLNTKREEVVRRKQQAAGSKLDELIKQLDEMKQMMLDLESKIIKEKAETEAARASLAFNDIV